jgi:hypothetical protein
MPSTYGNIPRTQGSRSNGTNLSSLPAFGAMRTGGTWSKAESYKPRREYRRWAPIEARSADAPTCFPKTPFWIETAHGTEHNPEGAIEEALYDVVDNQIFVSNTRSKFVHQAAAGDNSPGGGRRQSCGTSLRAG